MNIMKRIISYEPMDIQIEEITLLSIDEYERCRKNISILQDCWWWLRSPGYGSSHAADVLYNGSVYSRGDSVDYRNGVVRPVVVFRTSESPKIGDKFEMAGYTWTMIADNMALCDVGVGRMPFRNDWRAADANIYDASDIKKWLENWARKNGIKCVTTKGEDKPE